MLVGASPGAGDNEISDACQESLVAAPNGDNAPILGNIAERFEVSPDNTVFIFHLRQGLRWSDGMPVTTEDVDFAWNKVMLDERVNPGGVPQHLRSGGRVDGAPLQLEILDEYTFRLTSAEPYGAFLSWMGSYVYYLKPKHFLQCFHIDYTPIEQMQKALRAAELDTDEWSTLLMTHDLDSFVLTDRRAVGYPVLGPWRRVESPDGRVVMMRNPYYFKVDMAGNQLPYIDRYESISVASGKIIPMLVISGDVNMLRINANLQDLPLYAQHAKGKYRLVTEMTRHNPPWGLFLNLTNPDPSWRRVVNDIRFRQALDMLLPRQQIVDDLYFGMGGSSPWTPGQYNPRKAAALLDDMGMDKRDRQGYRLAPDGQRFTIRFELVPHSDDLLPASELIIEELREVGIRCEMKVVSHGLRQMRIQANQLNATLLYIDTGHWDNLWVLDFLPDARAQYGPVWAEWMRTNGARGEEPPDWVKDGYDIHRQAMRIRPDSREAQAVLARLKTWMHANIPVFPLCHDVANLLIVPHNLGNIAHAGLAQPATFAAEQFFFKE